MEYLIRAMNEFGNAFVIGCGVAVGIKIGAEITLKRLMEIKEINITYHNPTVNNVSNIKPEGEREAKKTYKNNLVVKPGSATTKG